MKIYDFSDYKQYVREWIAQHPNEGRGLLRKMAEHLNVHSTLMSHIFHGEKELNIEQGLRLAKFFELNKAETNFLILLISYSRAGTVELKNHLKEQVENIQQEALDLKNRLKKSKAFTEEERGRFYSNWYYSGIRLATDLSESRTPEKIAQKLNLPETLVMKALTFLVEAGLCIKKGEKYNIGPSMTHVEANSPFVMNHHRNWRMKALERHAHMSQSEVAFTFPVTLSASDAKVLKKKIIEFIDEAQALVIKSPSEEMHCLNIDWVKIL